ncbi:hypothetical protein SAMN06295900_11320 [Trinickia caryophylli]|uniref:Uncharacterized protein n=1 Tax=Trinickia caryophylli TaxID=28094 RepID=A0A1X7G2E5_TRICW|nr:hypothetical protein SAMN06295900_11320 [Trinickia caryophylli]
MTPTDARRAVCRGAGRHVGVQASPRRRGTTRGFAVRRPIGGVVGGCLHVMERLLPFLAAIPERNEDFTLY